MCICPKNGPFSPSSGHTTCCLSSHSTVSDRNLSPTPWQAMQIHPLNPSFSRRVSPFRCDPSFIVQGWQHRDLHLLFLLPARQGQFAGLFNPCDELVDSTVRKDARLRRRREKRMAVRMLTNRETLKNSSSLENRTHQTEERERERSTLMRISFGYRGTVDEKETEAIRLKKKW